MAAQGLWVRSIIVIALCSVVVTAMLLDSRKSRVHSSRYFTQESILPPLSSLAEHISFNDTLTLPYSEAEGPSIPVCYTNDPRTVCQWLSDNLPNDEGGIIGFDTESFPSYYLKQEKSPFENTATVQLATPHSCLVIHLARSCGAASKACGPVLESILADPKFIKAGCSIDEDMMDLYALWGGKLEARSRLDLGFIGRSPGKKVGLKALTAAVVGVDLPKPRSVTLSDWSVVPLTEHQIIYGARDAWAGAAVANKLSEKNPSVFGVESLIKSLESELPISMLVERKTRRDNAKRTLGKLLRPYQKALRKGESFKVPKNVKRKAKNLRQVIKARVVEPTVVLGEDSFVDFDI